MAQEKYKGFGLDKNQDGDWNVIRNETIVNTFGTRSQARDYVTGLGLLRQAPPIVPENTGSPFNRPGMQDAYISLPHPVLSEEHSALIDEDIAQAQMRAIGVAPPLSVDTEYASVLENPAEAKEGPVVVILKAHRCWNSAKRKARKRSRLSRRTNRA